MGVTLPMHRVGVLDVVTSKLQLASCIRRIFHDRNEIVIEDHFEAVRNSNSTNHNEGLSVTALRCRSMQLVSKPRMIVLRKGKVSN